MVRPWRGACKGTAAAAVALQRSFAVSTGAPCRIQTGGTVAEPTLGVMAIASPTIVRLRRGYVRVAGPDAADFLERMLSNEVVSLEPGREARPALLLTPKGRIVAPLGMVREEPEAFLLITETELAETVASTLLRSRFAAKCEIAVKPYRGYLHVGADPGEGVVNRDYGVEAWESWSEEERDAADPAELEALRIETGTPAWGKELDETVLPAEAGLDETHVSFTKGCYPGQEPIARLYYRGHPNRRLRVLDVADAKPGDEILLGEKVVGRVTSAVPGRALGYVRREVPEDAVLQIDGAEARLHLTARRP
jgi:folate-binding protein YgfZ